MGSPGSRGRELVDDLHGLVGLALIEPQLRQHQVGVGVARPQANRVSQRRARAHDLLALEQHAAHQQLGVGLVGETVEHLVQLAFGAVELAQPRVLFGELGHQEGVLIVGRQGEAQLVERAAVISVVMHEPRFEVVRVRGGRAEALVRLRSRRHRLAHRLVVDVGPFRRGRPPAPRLIAITTPNTTREV